MERHDSFCVRRLPRCGARYLVEHARLAGVAPRPGHPSGGGLCAKGRAAPEIQAHPLRDECLVCVAVPLADLEIDA